MPIDPTRTGRDAIVTSGSNRIDPTRPTFQCPECGCSFDDAWGCGCTNEDCPCSEAEDEECE
jgi:hypothetical protein